MASFITKPFMLYEEAVESFLNGGMDWDSDSHYCVLLTSSYSPSSTHSTLSDVVGDECQDSDYNRVNMSGETVYRSGGFSHCDANDISFGSAVTITAAHLVVVVGTVGGSQSTDRLVGYMPLDVNGADVSSYTSGFGITWTSGYIFSTKSTSSNFEFSSTLPAAGLSPLPTPNESSPVAKIVEGVNLEYQGTPKLAQSSQENLATWWDMMWEADYILSEPDEGDPVVTWDSTSRYDMFHGPHLFRYSSGLSIYPTFRESVGGYPALEFLTTSAQNCKMQLATDSTGPWQSTAGPWLVGIIVTMGDVSFQQNLWSTSAGYPYIGIKATGEWEMGRQDQTTSITGAVATTSRQLICGWWNGANSLLFADEVITKGNGQVTNMQYLGLGVAANAQRHFYVHALMVSRSVHTEIHALKAMDLAHNYAQGSWGV